MACDYLGIAVNLRNLVSSQYQNFNFNSMTKTSWGDYIGVNSDGVFTIEGNTDGSNGISAFLELPTFDFKNGRIRRLFVGYESDGQIRFKIKNDDSNERTYILTPIKGSLKQEGARVPVGRDGKGRYWTIRVENVRGSNFKLDEIEAAIVYLNRRGNGK